MSPKLEELIQLYGKLHESPVNERDVYFNHLKDLCESEARAVGVTWRDMFGYTKRKYFDQLRADEKRHGRKL
jgi:hypothetical protein